MQWCIEIPFSLFTLYFNNNNKNNLLSLFILTMTLFLNIINLPLSVHTLSMSTCSPYLYTTHVDIRTNNQYIEPCPVSLPCQCICEIKSKRLWIDCFYRQLKTLPIFKKIQTNNTRIQWNVDLGFNLIDNITLTNNVQWLPDNMRIDHMILSNSLAYDLIVQLNLTHRHLIDRWPSQEHLDIIDDHFQLFDNDDEVKNKNKKKKTKQNII